MDPMSIHNQAMFTHQQTMNAFLLAQLAQNSSESSSEGQCAHCVCPDKPKEELRWYDPEYVTPTVTILSVLVVAVLLWWDSGRR